MAGNLSHSSFISYCKYNDLKPWYITTTPNETIEFKNNTQKAHLNALLIEAENTDLYIRILPSDFILFVPANESRSYDYTPVDSIQIMGNASQKLRWAGMFY